MADRFNRSPPDAETFAMRLLLFVTVVALCACGQSGALYLPESQSPAAAPATPAMPGGATAPAEEKDQTPEKEDDEGTAPATPAPVEPAP